MSVSHVRPAGVPASSADMVIVDASGRMASLDAFSRQRVSQPHSVFDCKQTFDANPEFFEQELAGAGASTHVVAKSASELTTGTVSGALAARQSKSYFNYQPGKSHLILVTFNLMGQETNVRKRAGYFDIDNGLFLELGAAGASLVVRTDTSGSPVDSVTLQADWSIDTMDGTGPSGETLDLSMTQILVVDFQWLGVGSVRFGFSINGVIRYVHQAHHSNMLSVVYMRSPNLPIRWEIENTGTATGAPQMDAICCSVMSEGGVEQNGVIRSASRGRSGISIGSSLTPVISIRLTSTHLRAPVVPVKTSLMTTTGGNLYWQLSFNPTITGGAAASWSAESDTVEADIARDGVVSGGTVVDSGYISNNQDAAISAIASQLKLASSIAGVPDELVLAVSTVSGPSETVFGAMTWLEVL